MVTGSSRPASIIFGVGSVEHQRRAPRCRRERKSIRCGVRSMLERVAASFTRPSPLRSTLHRTMSHSDPAAFWNGRYGEDGFAYGTEPNAFVRHVAEAGMLPPSSTLVELGCGEGRNAVYLATQGHHVTAVDFAEEGVKKARLLAERAGVIDKLVAAVGDATTWQPRELVDAVVSVFLHLPPPAQPKLWQNIRKASRHSSRSPAQLIRSRSQILKPGGLFVAELYSPDQVLKAHGTGGPPVVEMCTCSCGGRGGRPGLTSSPPPSPALNPTRHFQVAAPGRVWCARAVPAAGGARVRGARGQVPQRARRGRACRVDEGRGQCMRRMEACVRGVGWGRCRARGKRPMPGCASERTGTPPPHAPLSAFTRSATRAKLGCRTRRQRHIPPARTGHP